MAGSRAESELGIIYWEGVLHWIGEGRIGLAGNGVRARLSSPRRRLDDVTMGSLFLRLDNVRMVSLFFFTMSGWALFFFGSRCHDGLSFPSA
jgi:hypothetical protein